MRLALPLAAGFGIVAATVGGLAYHHRHEPAKVAEADAAATSPQPLSPELSALLTEVMSKAAPPSFKDLFLSQPPQLREPDSLQQIELRTKIAALDEAQIQAMIASLQASFPPTPKSAEGFSYEPPIPAQLAYMALLEGLAAKNPAAAFTHADRPGDIPGSLNSAVVIGMNGEWIPVLAAAATKDPAVARKWFEANPNAFPCLTTVALERMMEAICAHDPAAALEQAALLGDGWIDGVVPGIAYGAETAEQRMALIATLRKSPAAIVRLKGKILQGIGTVASQKDGDREARAWLSSADDLTEAEREEIQAGISNASWSAKSAELDRKFQKEERSVPWGE